MRIVRYDRACARVCAITLGDMQSPRARLLCTFSQGKLGFVAAMCEIQTNFQLSFLFILLKNLLLLLLCIFDVESRVDGYL